MQSVRRAIGDANELVLLHKPYFPRRASEYVTECISTGWVSSAGAFVARFEEKLSEYTGAKRAVAVVNGTAALQVCLSLSGVGQGDEVLVPSLSFVATANAVHYTGGTPHFVDVCPNRLGMDPERLAHRLSQCAEYRQGVWINRESGNRLSAICPMHCFGHPCDLDGLMEVASKYGLPLVEDAAESLGSFYKGKHTGRFGKLAAISFNGNKIMTTGGGGAILTDADDVADRAKHLTTTAKVAHKWEFHHDEIGWNYRMPNLNAALGFAQLECLDELLVAKRELALQYQEEFSKLAGVEFQGNPEDSQSNNWLNCIMLNKEDGPSASINESTIAKRDAVLDALNSANYQSRPIRQPLHTLPMYAACPHGELSVTTEMYTRCINVPSSADLCRHYSVGLSNKPLD